MSEPVVGVTGAGGHRGAKMTPAQWSEAILLWKQGEITLRELSKRYGVSIRRLQEKFNDVGAKKGELIKRQHAAQEAALVIPPNDMAKRIFDTKNESYLQLSAMRRLAVKMVMDTVKENKRLSVIAGDMKSLKDAVAVIEICREGAYRVLGLDKEQDKGAELPSLEIRGLTQEEIEDLQAESLEDAQELMNLASAETAELEDQEDGNPS